jgi:hypothetical protein
VTQYHLTSGPLNERLVSMVLRAGLDAAKWNRNRATDVPIALVTTDRQDEALLSGWFSAARTAETERAECHGKCFYSRERGTAHWYRDTGDLRYQLDTVAHETAHSYVAWSSGHDVSFRRLFVLTYAAGSEVLPEYFNRDLERVAYDIVLHYTMPRLEGFYGNPWDERGDGPTYHMSESNREYDARCADEVSRILQGVERFRSRA